MTTDTDPAMPRRLDPQAALARVVPGRSCGTCTLCCKLIAVIEFDKPPGVWCPHVVKKGGCAIHPTRPNDCRTFFCHWMTERSMGPEWKPEKSKLVAVPGEGGHMTVFVDPGVPGAWRQAPYYEIIKRWSAEGARTQPMRIVTIRVGARVTVVFPDREVEVGEIGPDESLHLVPGPNGSFDARKIARPQG